MSIYKIITDPQFHPIYYVKCGPHWYAFTRSKWYFSFSRKVRYTYTGKWFVKRSRSLYYLRKKVGQLHKTQEICPLQFLVETGLNYTKCYETYALVV